MCIRDRGLVEEQNRQRANWQHLWFFTWLSKYHERLKPFEEFFNQERIHYVSTEHFQSEPLEVLAGIFEFLDIPCIEIDTSKKINTGGKPRSHGVSIVTDWIRRVPAIHNIAKRITSKEFREKIRNNNLTTPKLPDDIQTKLDIEFADTKAWLVEKFTDRP